MDHGQFVAILSLNGNLFKEKVLGEVRESSCELRELLAALELPRLGLEFTANILCAKELEFITLELSKRCLREPLLLIGLGLLWLEHRAAGWLRFRGEWDL